MTLVASTVATRNYLAAARLTARSWMDHHPDSAFTILVVDPESGPDPTWRHRGVTIISPADLGVGEAELRTLAAIYSPMELTCALKPALSRRLLQDGATAAVHLDGDVEVLAPMDELEALAAAHGVVLIPHSLEPLPDDGTLPDDQVLTTAGAFNAGVMAFGRTGIPFLDWWERKLARHGVHDLPAGLHGDQRWLDLVPAWFDHHILRDPTYNVAYWNLHERPATWDGERLRVFDEPVRCFHYSGLSPDSPWRLTGYTADRGRVEMTDQPAVARVIRRHLDQLRTLRAADAPDLPYRWSHSAGGLPLDRRIRAMWRDALLLAEAHPAVAAPPDPFDPDQAPAFAAWLAERPEGSRAPRYATRVWLESPVLQRQFPGVAEDAVGHPDDATRFLRWLADNGEAMAAMPAALLPDPEEIPVDEADDTPRRPPLRPEVRSQQPLDQAAAVRTDLETLPLNGRRLPATAQRAIDVLLGARDRRHDEVAGHLLAAVDELAARVAELGLRLNALGDRVDEDAERTDGLAGDVRRMDATQHQHLADVARRLHEAQAALEAEAGRIDGALTHDEVTAAIVDDAERRLSGDLVELRRRVDKLTEDTEPAEDPGPITTTEDAEGR